MSKTKHAISLLLFFFAVTYITYPLLFHLGELATGFGDELNYAWIYSQLIHNVLSGQIINIAKTNIFYPYQIALSNSDPNLFSSFFSLIPFLLIKEPIVTVNFTLFSSLVFLGFSMYVLSFYLTKDFLVSVFSGIMVIFSPAVLSFYVHLQMLAVAFVPLSILFILIFIKSGKSKYLIFSLLCLLLQTYNNFLAGYFILTSYLIIFIYKWKSDQKKISKLLIRKNIMLFILSILLLIPIMLPYYTVSKEFNYVRDIRDSVHFALQPEDLLYSSNFSRFHSILNTLPFNRVSQNNEFKPGYIGLIFSLLTIATLYVSLKNIKKNKQPINAMITIALTGLILCFGPVLHLGRHTVKPLIPLPYALFYYTLPGFQGFRNSARWEMLFIIAIAIAITICLHSLTKKYSLKTKSIIYLLLIAGCIAELNFPMHFEKVPAIANSPKVHHWLATTPKDTIYIEMPVYNWNMIPYGNIEFFRMYYSTIHFRRTVNGGGGFTPPPWEKMVYMLDETFPSQSTLEKLKKLKIDYLIVHKNEFDRMHKDRFTINKKRIKNGNTIISSLSKNKSIKKVKQFEDTYVFTFN